MGEVVPESDNAAFYYSAAPPEDLVDDWRFHVREIAQAQDVGPVVRSAPQLPGVYGSPNRPGQGEVSAS